MIIIYMLRITIEIKKFKLTNITNKHIRCFIIILREVEFVFYFAIYKLILSLNHFLFACFIIRI